MIPDTSLTFFHEKVNQEEGLLLHSLGNNGTIKP